MLAEADAAEALAADQLARPCGRLRVAMPVLFGRQCVSPVLLKLARRHSGLELDLSFNDHLIDLAEGGFDLAIRTGDLADSAGIIARRLARQRMIVCALRRILRNLVSRGKLLISRITARSSIAGLAGYHPGGFRMPRAPHRR